jgi:sortase A
MSTTAPEAPRFQGSGIDRFVHALRTRPWIRRSLSLLSLLLLVGGVAMLGYPLFTNLYQDRLQGRLNRQFASPDLQQAYEEGKVEVGDSLTRIKIPTIDVNTIVVQGTTASALRAGAGHYPQSPLPCENGNVAIAGHRTTYGKPFANVDRLKVGDEISLLTPVGGCIYEVSQPPFVVDKNDLSVLNPKGGKELTLTSCHPKGSAKQRIIIKAKLKKALCPDASARRWSARSPRSRCWAWPCRPTPTRSPR